MLGMCNQLLDHRGWANARILTALAASPSPHQKAQRLLAHLLLSERIWLLRLKGEDTSTIDKSAQLSLADCEELAAENQQAFTDLLNSLGEADLHSLVKYKNFKGTEFHTPIREILMHISLHGTYHRGQIAIVMGEQGDTPVDTDFITFCRERSVE